MNGSINVLMFSGQFRPIVGGAERQAEKLAKALVSQGVRVTLLTPALVQGLPAEEQDEGFHSSTFPGASPGFADSGRSIFSAFAASLRASLINTSRAQACCMPTWPGVSWPLLRNSHAGGQSRSSARWG